MITKIKRFSILQTGKLLAVLYGFIALVILPIALIMLVVNPKAAAPMLFMVILYPAFGFIGGIVGAAIYNLAARLVGGLEITLEMQEAPLEQP
jgi:hypothetical protein